jgi:hypothetical protein
MCSFNNDFCLMLEMFLFLTNLKLYLQIKLLSVLYLRYRMDI